VLWTPHPKLLLRDAEQLLLDEFLQTAENTVKNEDKLNRRQKQRH
jgi:hypothetical protein